MDYWDLRIFWDGYVYVAAGDNYLLDWFGPAAFFVQAAIGTNGADYAIARDPGTFGVLEEAVEGRA